LSVVTYLQHDDVTGCDFQLVINSNFGRIS